MWQNSSQKGERVIRRVFFGMNWMYPHPLPILAHKFYKAVFQHGVLNGFWKPTLWLSNGTHQLCTMIVIPDISSYNCQEQGCKDANLRSVVQGWISLLILGQRPLEPLCFRIFSCNIGKRSKLSWNLTKGVVHSLKRLASSYPTWQCWLWQLLM